MFRSISVWLLGGLLVGCSLHAIGWHWEPAENSAPDHLFRAKEACHRALDDNGGREISPMAYSVNEWDEVFKICMAEHGWKYVEEP